MSIATRWVIAVFWALITLLCVFGGFFGIFGLDNDGNHMYGVSVVCFMIAGLIGKFFVYRDFQFLLGKKNGTK